MDAHHMCRAKKFMSDEKIKRIPKKQPKMFRVYVKQLLENCQKRTGGYEKKQKFWYRIGMKPCE